MAAFFYYGSIQVNRVIYKPLENETKPVECADYLQLAPEFRAAVFCRDVKIPS